MDLEHRIVRRHILEGNVRMPAYTCVAARIAELMGKSTALLLLLGTDYTDLVAQFTALFRQWMDMQTR